MGLTDAQLRADLDALAGQTSWLSPALAAVGYPEPRGRERGWLTLLRTIVGQQISVHAAAAVWRKLEAAGVTAGPATVLALGAEGLRAAGLSRQKAGYALSLAGLVDAGTLPLDALPADDELAIALLTEVKGIGRWSAEIYLLFAEGRGDVWPAGDLAVQEQVRRWLALEARPDERATRALAERWRPYRGAAAIFAWHHYMAPPL